MKRLKYIAFTVLLASFSLQSCDLERYPLTDLSEDNFWTDDKNAELALTSLYRGSITNGLEYSVSDFWSYHGMLFMEHLTDNAYDRRGENNPFFNISSGKLLNNNSFIKNYWSSAYKRIGLCNRFLEGIANAPESEQKTRMVAEARFLRATQYHYLASYFKDVPLVTKTLTGEEANTVEKETQANILSWCVTEFKESAADLPRFKDIPNSETGRACKQAALAFWGRTCMLMQDWAGGAAAYKEIIDYGDNSIHPVYRELFHPSTGVGNKENIYYISYLENYFGCGLPQHILSAKDAGWSLSNPSAGLFESYEFKDGTPFSYDDSRYNPDNLGENRDPRLDYTIYYNGATFMGTEYRMSPDYEASKKERLDYSSEASKTGFMWRKYFDENPINDLNSYSAVTPVIRYAEVLLNYAEAMYELGTTGKALDDALNISLNLVRLRVNPDMPKLTTSFASENSLNMREEIRRERTIELYNEGFRVDDLKRWNTAIVEMPKPILGVKWTGTDFATSWAGASNMAKDSDGCLILENSRRWGSKNDLYPLPVDQCQLNPNLGQNPGWQ